MACKAEKLQIINTDHLQLNINTNTVDVQSSPKSVGPSDYPKPTILHKCKNYLFIDKPCDVPVNSNDPSRTSVETLMNKYYPDLQDKSVYHSYRFTHRLDLATSGVLCLALTKKAASWIQTAFLRREVNKHYLALVYGYIEKKSQVIDIAIGRDTTEGDVYKMCVEGSEGCEDPKDAQTLLITLERGTYKQQPATKVLLVPYTGRTHQLRVHCRHIGHRVVGDFMYSDRQDVDPYRMMLHAYRLKASFTQAEIDIITCDPFNTNIDKNWVPQEIIDSYDNVIKGLDILS